jgi:hypothetical protein
MFETFGKWRFWDFEKLEILKLKEVANIKTSRNRRSYDFEKLDVETPRNWKFGVVERLEILRLWVIIGHFKTFRNWRFRDFDKDYKKSKILRLLEIGYYETEKLNF